MIPRPIRNITAADLQDLITNGVREGKTIEYKRQLPGPKDKDGLPKKLVGFESDGLDAEIQRIESMLRSGLEPRLPHYDTQLVDLDGKRHVLILRIPQSWSAPHRVTFRDHAKFYARNSSGKYHLDVGELRIAFTASEALGDRIRRFREERLAKIVARDTHISLLEGPIAVLHTIPLRAFTTRETVDASKRDRLTTLVYPLNFSSATHQVNLEGFVGFAGDGQHKQEEYHQLFRKGIVESAFRPIIDDRNRIGMGYEYLAIENLRRHLTFLQQSDVPPPLFVFLALLGVKGTTPIPIGHASFYGRLPLKQNDLILPEIVVDDFAAEASTILRPLFDTVWNAYGYERSLNYDQNGKWIVR